MFDNLKMLTQLGPMMAKAREMQAKMAEVQARLPGIKAEGSSGGSLVTVTANGLMEITEIVYATSAPLTDTELLSDLTRAAVNQALRNVKEKVQREMQGAAGDMDLSAFQGMLGGGGGGPGQLPS